MVPPGSSADGGIAPYLRPDALLARACPAVMRAAPAVDGRAGRRDRAVAAADMAAAGRAATTRRSLLRLLGLSGGFLRHPLLDLGDDGAPGAELLRGLLDVAALWVAGDEPFDPRAHARLTTDGAAVQVEDRPRGVLLRQLLLLPLALLDFCFPLRRLTRASSSSRPAFTPRSSRSRSRPRFGSLGCALIE